MNNQGEPTSQLNGTEVPWQLLSQLRDPIQGIVTCPTRKDAWERVQRVFKQALETERVAVWGVTGYWAFEERDPVTLRLMIGGTSDKQPCWPDPTGGLLPRVFEALREGSPTNEIAEKLADMTFADQWERAIVVRLVDRQQRLQGVVVAAESPRFGKEHEPLLEELAIRCSLCIEQGRALYLLAELRRKMKSTENFQTVLRLILHYAVGLLGASRGEIGYWNWDHNNGAGGFGVVSENADGTAQDWREFNLEGEHLAVWDRKREKGYSSGRTRSLAADSDESLVESLVVLLEQTDAATEPSVSLPPRRIAVLSLERPTKERPFDELDRDLLRLLLARACDDFKLVGLWPDFVAILDKLCQSDNLAEVGKIILESIRATYGFDCGIIYYPDYKEQVLREFGRMGLAEKAENFCYPLVNRDDGNFEMSFAWRLFRVVNADWVENPQDPTQWGTRVSRRGVESLKIEDPMVGLRVVGTNGEAIGALVIWRSRTVNNPPPQPRHQTELLPFANLASLVVRAFLAQERQTTLRDEVGRILLQMQHTFDRNKNLDAVLEGVRAVGFDRVRVFEWLPGGRMKGLKSKGMTPSWPPAKGYVASIHPEDGEVYNHCVEQLVTRIDQGRDQLLARTHKPDKVGEVGEINVDPHHAQLGKNRDTPWVDVPIVNAGKLYGELAADNQDTKQPLTETEALYLSVFGGLAARAFAAAEAHGTLNAQALAKLHRRELFEKSQQLFFRALVHFLRHENGGLGFGRVICLRWDAEKRGFAFAYAAGQLEKSACIRAESDARSEELDKLLNEVLREEKLDWVREADTELNTRLKGYTLAGNHSALESFRLSEPSGVPTWEQPAVHDFDEPELRRLSGNPVSPPLALILRSGTEADHAPLGLLIADRVWGRPLGEVDRAALQAFAIEAGQLASFRSLYQRTLVAEMSQASDRIFRGLRKEISSGVDLLGKVAGTLPALSERLEGNQLAAVQVIEEAIRRLRGLTSAMAAVTEANRAPWENVEVENIFREVKRRISEQVGEEKTSCLKWAESFGLGTVTVKRESVVLALIELVRNSLKHSGHDSPTVTLDCKVEHQTVNFVVRDNGNGMSPKLVETLNGVDIATRQPDHEIGLGILIAHQVAAAHGGRLKIESLAADDFRESSPSTGTCVVLNYDI